MKVWYHLIAATVGLALAALIVYLVFGSASQEGARQDGDAGSLAATGGGLCGSIGVDEATSAKARSIAEANPPALFDAKGPIAAIREDRPEQRQWVARVHAAGGLCLDELSILASGEGARANNTVEVVMSTTDDVTAQEASAFAGGVLAQAFTPPFVPRLVTVSTTVGDERKPRTLVVSSRAWRAFEVRRRQLGRPPTVANLKLFQQAAAYGAADLRITGW